MHSILSFIKREPVLIISALAAAISCIFVPPDPAYADYIDFRTLALLYCLMTVVSGFQKAGVFTALAHTLCRKAQNTRSVAIILVGLCFFTSMLITNDVALLTFVPFSIVVLGLTDRRQDMIAVIVLETAAANLGSMLTPVGNPQNLYLYSYYNIPFGQFFSITGPIWLLSLALLLAACLIVFRSRPCAFAGETPVIDRKTLLLCTVQFLICLLTVIRLLNWPVMLAAVMILFTVFDRSLLKQADFLLLLTFVAFFVFAGNLARIEKITHLLENILSGREYLTALLTSQVISNVPAALLLSGFTGNYTALLLGVNAGGLGTPIASLASLISLKLYLPTKHASGKKFLLMFLAVNAVLLALLTLFVMLTR